MAEGDAEKTDLPDTNQYVRDAGVEEKNSPEGKLLQHLDNPPLPGQPVVDPEVIAAIEAVPVEDPAEEVEVTEAINPSRVYPETVAPPETKATEEDLRTRTVEGADTPADPVAVPDNAPQAAPLPQALPADALATDIAAAPAVASDNHSDPSQLV